MPSETATTPLNDFPFYHNAKDWGRLSTDMTDEEKKQLDQDWADAKSMIDYRRNSGWDLMAKRGMMIYNVVQTAKPTDEVSRIFLGYTRTQIDRGIDQMTEGEPDFDFEPYGPSDSKKTIIWKHLLRKVMSDSNYRFQQEVFFRDYFTMGCGVFEVYIDYPQRTIRVPGENGTFTEEIKRDYRRPKVGIRALNPLNCWRNPNISDLTQVPSCLRRRIVTWDQFAQDYGRVRLADGEKKYKNLNKLSVGKYVCLYEYQNEITDSIRIYATSFSTEEDSYAKTPPEKFGVMIYDKSLSLHQELENGKLVRCDGHNLLGMCSLRWGTYFDVYDKNWTGEHSVYGMGLPQRIEGEDMILQTIFNIQIDNYRWANAVALNYEGNNAESYIDVDSNRLVGGELIDGKITPQPLGIYRPNDFGSMKDVLDNSVIPATGINHNQITGDTSKTAFEFAQRIRQSNRSAEQRLYRLESETFKPIGILLLSGALTEITVDEWEAMTEEQVKIARENIKRGTATAEDYKDLNEENPQRRVKQYIRMAGEKIREDFSTTKYRKLNYNETGNTLIFDQKMEADISYIPIVKEYVYPMDYLESGLQMDVIVDTKRMLGDLKAQDVQNFQAATNFLIELKQLGYNGADWDKIVQATLDFANINSDDVLLNKNMDEKTGQRKRALDIMNSIINPLTSTPQQNAPSIVPSGAPAPGTPGPGQPPPSPLERTAAGLG